MNNLICGMGLSGGKQVGAAARLGLYKGFRARDAQLAEINPLFITKDGQAVAGDGKLIIDDNSLSRQPRYPPEPAIISIRTWSSRRPKKVSLSALRGDIALMCAAPASATPVFDLIHDTGRGVATYGLRRGQLHAGRAGHGALP